MEEADILLLESFYSGHYKELIDFLSTLPWTRFYTLPPDAVQQLWSTPSKEVGDEDLRVRTSALAFSELVHESPSLKTLFTSSAINLCELIALRPDLGKLRKIIYFHDNQVIYPVQRRRDRNFQHGYSEILSCLVADVVVFNTHHHMDMFLKWIDSFLNAMPPDNQPKPKAVASQIKPKCKVLFFPIDFHPRTTITDCVSLSSSASQISLKNTNTTVSQAVSSENLASKDPALRTKSKRRLLCFPIKFHKTKSSDCSESLDCASDVSSEPSAESGKDISSTKDTTRQLHIVWPYRFEQDKHPDLFFKTILRMKHLREFFRVSVFGNGEQPDENPEAFNSAMSDINDQLVVCRTEDKYHQVLQSADVVVSTARQDFCGASVLEAVHAGCTPLCPKKVLGTDDPSVFIEILPETCHEDCLWTTAEDLYRKLKQFVEQHQEGKFTKGIEMNPSEQFSWDALKSDYENLLGGRD